MYTHLLLNLDFLIIDMRNWIEKFDIFQPVMFLTTPCHSNFTKSIQTFANANICWSLNGENNKGVK